MRHSSVGLKSRTTTLKCRIGNVESGVRMRMLVATASPFTSRTPYVALAPDRVGVLSLQQCCRSRRSRRHPSRTRPFKLHCYRRFILGKLVFSIVRSSKEGCLLSQAVYFVELSGASGATPESFTRKRLLVRWRMQACSLSAGCLQSVRNCQLRWGLAGTPPDERERLLPVGLLPVGCFPVQDDWPIIKLR